MMARTCFSWKVFTACLVTFTGLFMPCSWSCDPLSESTDLKAYRSPIVVEGTLIGANATVSRKTLKGEFSQRVSEIQLTGFDSENPCTGPISSFTEGTNYLLFIRQTSNPGIYSLMGNPEETTRTGKRAVRKVDKSGGPPLLAKRIKPKYNKNEGEKMLLLPCAGKGTPRPLMYWMRNGIRLQDNQIPRLKIKSSKRSVKLQIRKLDKELHEGTYSCVVTNTVDPPVIGNSTLSICAISCQHGVQHARKCKCVCDEGYSGELCDVADFTTTSPTSMSSPSLCALDCGSNGELDENECTCVCHPGFGGPMCSEVLPTDWTPPPEDCQLDCGAHGTRDIDAPCACVCDEGYSGEDCSNGDALACEQGTFCENGGTCTLIPSNDEQSGGTQTLNCTCPVGFGGERCQDTLRCPGLHCGPNGNLSPDDCVCVCQPRYSGRDCSVLSDNHTQPCSGYYANYCLNGGTCHQLVGIDKPTCKCPENKRGERCDTSILKTNKCYEGYCLNNGTCRYSEKRDKRRCICPDLYRGSPRCDLKFRQYDTSNPPSVGDPSIKENSMKVIVTLTVIFFSLLVVLLLVVFVYIKNKNYQEAQRRKRVKRAPLRPPNYNGHLHHQNSNNQAGVSPTAAGDIEMEPRRPSAPPTVLRMESDSSFHGGHTQRSHSLDVRYGNSPVQVTPVRTMHNGHARKISQASIHSNHSTSSHRSNASTPGSAPGKRRRMGYEAVPAVEPADRIEEYHGDTAACEDASIVMLPREDQCRDADSECSSEAGDVVDVPNPQICAIETRLAQPGEDYDTGADRDLSADVVNANVHFTPNYAQNAASPVHSPAVVRGHLHENPLHTDINITAMSHVPNDFLNNDVYYGSRYEDDIDRSSPPHAV
ncbi:uncharacterized protein [Diadema antillarum]|uniref:uncharacterized protein n=1 Tax=Diadema antillarum TaxID=105358 RepID=UPI003A83617C